MKKNNFINNDEIKIHNNLAFARYSLNLSEQKLFIYAIRCINQEEDDFTESKFKLADFAQDANLDLTTLFKQIDKMTDNIMKTIIVAYDTKTDNFLKYNLTQRCEYNDGELTFHFSEDMKQFLLKLRKNYFLQPKSVLGFASIYSIRLYDFLKANSFAKENVIIELDELKSMLQLDDNYKKFSNFKARVLDKAISEINDHTDLVISYKTVLYNRKITHIDFSVQKEIKVKRHLLFGEFMDWNSFREQIGFSFTDSQIERLYSEALKATRFHLVFFDEIIEYMKLSYMYAKERNPVKLYSYYKKVLQNDYSKAIHFIKYTRIE